MSGDLGDFQTPPALVDAVLLCLMKMNQHWTRVLEPTCGRGNFIKGVLGLKTPPREIWGIELQSHYIVEYILLKLIYSILGRKAPYYKKAATAY